MKKIFSITAFKILLSASATFGQVHADSLVGSYAGKCYIKPTSVSAWTIYQDTLIAAGDTLAQYMDTVYCKVALNGCGWGWQRVPFHTSYTYCNTAITGNCYSWFHSMDSITAIADSNTSSYFSIHFYGKRVSNNVGMDVSETQPKEELTLYPNPSSTILFIECERLNAEAELQIIDATGKNVKTEKMKDKKSEIDISSLKDGIYFIQMKTGTEMLSKKIVIQR
jgi:hypothetical protein